MTKPNECKWCGCYEIIRDGFPTINGGREVLFGCRSVWQEDAKVWYRDPLRCGGQVGRLYRRIADSVASLRAIQRHEVTPYTSNRVNWERTPDGSWVLQREVEAVVDDLVRTLEGET